ncbi:MAG: bile acid:sodium symporter family protein [Opitutales bacterium]
MSRDSSFSTVWQRLWRDYGFVVAMLAVIGLAWLIPGPAAKGGFLRSAFTTQLGVWVIFFLQGLTLPTNELTGGLKPVRAHGFSLCWNYLGFPLCALLVAALARPLLSEALWQGFLFLGILPTTISSAIALTAAAGGRAPLAIVSCVSSNLLAVLLVPALCLLALQAAQGADVPAGPLLGKLALLIVLPLIAGQLLRQRLRALVLSLKPHAKKISNGIILYLVHVAFANSVQSGFWQTQRPTAVLVVLGFSAILLALVSAAVWGSSRWLRLGGGERVAVFFSASQKSLATGLPLASSILGALEAAPPLSALVLPLLCYHPLQLILGAAVVPRLSRAAR